VHSAFTGHEPLRIIPNIDPDLAIIDHFLPGITGAQLVRQLRAQSRFVSLPILVVSTGGRDARSEALASGATVYLDKPVLLTQLVSTIGTILMEPIE
jgi:DNA-binding response OmpR family regulator